MSPYTTPSASNDSRARYRPCGLLCGLAVGWGVCGPTGALIAGGTLTQAGPQRPEDGQTQSGCATYTERRGPIRLLKDDAQDQPAGERRDTRQRVIDPEGAPAVPAGRRRDQRALRAFGQPGHEAECKKQDPG